jgi:hypothetical protein
VQYLRNFRRFGVNTDYFGRQREDRILVAEKEIPHKIQERHFQQSFSINVFRFNGDSYLEFLKEVLPDLLEEIPLAIR